MITLPLLPAGPTPDCRHPFNVAAPPPPEKSVSFMRYAICRSLRRPWPAPRTMTACERNNCERDKSLALIHVVHMPIPFLLLPLPLLLPRRGLKWREARVRQKCGNTEAQRPTIISHQRCLSMYYCNSEGHRSRNGTYGISLSPPHAFTGLFITSSTLLESITALMIHSA